MKSRDIGNTWTLFLRRLSSFLYPLKLAHVHVAICLAVRRVRNLKLQSQVFNSPGVPASCMLTFTVRKIDDLMHWFTMSVQWWHEQGLFNVAQITKIDITVVHFEPMTGFYTNIYLFCDSRLSFLNIYEIKIHKKEWQLFTPRYQNMCLRSFSCTRHLFFLNTEKITTFLYTFTTSISDKTLRIWCR